MALKFSNIKNLIKKLACTIFNSICLLVIFGSVSGCGQTGKLDLPMLKSSIQKEHPIFSNLDNLG